MTEISGLQLAAEKLNSQFNGDGLLASKEFETAPGINDRIDAAVSGMVYSSNGPTITHVDAFKAGKSAFVAWLAELKQLDTQFKQLQAKLDAAKVPYTPGRTFFFDTK